MLVDSKKNGISCMSLLSELAEASMAEESFRTPHNSRTIPISMSARSGMETFDPRTPVPSMYYGSPEIEYFATRAMRQAQRHASRWKDDWEELELLVSSYPHSSEGVNYKRWVQGKGAFGSVVKARNKIDSRIYAVKKVRLKTMQNDNKIMREVNALSRLNHRFIVRYYTTWIEVVEAPSTTVSDDSSAENSVATSAVGSEEEEEDDDSTEDYTQDTTTSAGSVSTSRRRRSTLDERFLPVNGGFGLNIDVEDFSDDMSGSQSSFPSIHFEGSGSAPGSEESSEDEEDVFDTLFTPGAVNHSRGVSSESVPPVTRTLYIQMVCHGVFLTVEQDVLLMHTPFLGIR